MQQTLNLKQTQNLVMTAKLQQAVRILQLSALDLRAVIERAYLENPVLEMEDAARPAEEPEMKARADERAALLSDLAEDEGREDAAQQEGGRSEFAAPVALSLEEELLREIDFTFSDLREKAVAVFLVGSLDHRGYLTVPLHEAARATGTSEAEAAAVLRVLQSFEPAGVGARSVSECMRLQAERAGVYEGLVGAVIDRHLRAVAEGRFKDIAQAEDATLHEVQCAVDVVRTFHPKPGSVYGREMPAYIRADVSLREEDGHSRVVVCDDHLPRLFISRLYRNPAGLDAEAQKYIEQRMSAALWLMKCIARRKETLQKVTEEVVRRQRDFALRGERGLRPLTMRMVADAVGVHESTVSRAVANKYIELPRGTVPLKSFFTAGLKAEVGEDLIAARVRAEIAAIIGAENPRAPLSDSKIAELLALRRMPVARRTVVKYRKQLGYASSAGRRRY